MKKKEVLKELESLMDLVANHLMPQKSNPDWRISMKYYDEVLEIGEDLIDGLEEEE